MAPRPLPGDNDMPRVAGRGFGASERFAVSPGREAEGYLQIPGGQSGHPLSPFYRAGYEDWVTGRARPLLPGPTVHTLVVKAAAASGE
jgi:penicillin amidase